MIEDLRLASLSLRDKGLIEHIQNVLADLLELGLDFLAVLADDGDVLVRALGLLLLLNRGDDAPRGPTGADDILVGNREQIALVDGELTTQLCMSQYLFDDVDESTLMGISWGSYVRNLL